MLSLFEAELSSGAGRRLVRGEASTADYLASVEGPRLARVDLDSDAGEVRVLVRDGDAWRDFHRQALVADAAAPFTAMGFARGGALVVRGHVDRAPRALFRLSPGEPPRRLFGDETYDVGAVISDPYSGEIVGAEITRDRVETVFFDPGLRAWRRRFAEEFEGLNVRLVSWDRERERFIVFVEGDYESGAYFLYRSDWRALVKLGEQRPALPDEAPAATRRIHYQARDGRRLSAYWTAPQGARTPPLIIMPPWRGRRLGMMPGLIGGRRRSPGLVMACSSPNFSRLVGLWTGPTRRRGGASSLAR